MPAMSCACGKQFRVSDEYLGKRIRCPGCGDALRVEEPEPAADPAAIYFACDCGKRMRARAEFAGQAVACPACGEENRVPGRAAPRDGALTRERRPASHRDGPDDRRPARDEDEPRPRRKRRRKSNVALLAGVGVGTLALLTIVVLLGWRYFGGGRAASQLAVVPGDAAAFATIRVADLLANDVGKEVFAALPAEPRQALALAEQRFGLALKDLDRATVIVQTLPDRLDGPPPGEPPVWLAYHLNKPADPRKIREALDLPPDEHTHNGRRYHADHQSFLVFLDDRTILYGPRGLVTLAIDQVVKPRTQGELADLVARAGSRQLAMGVVLPPRLMAQIPANAGPVNLGALLETRKVFVGATFTGLLVESELSGSYPSDAKAKEAKEILDGFKALALLGLNQPQPGMDAEAARRARQSINAVNFNQQGSEVVAVARELTNLDDLRANLRQLDAGGFGLR